MSCILRLERRCSVAAEEAVCAVAAAGGTTGMDRGLGGKRTTDILDTEGSLPLLLRCTFCLITGDGMGDLGSSGGSKDAVGTAVALSAAPPLPVASVSTGKDGEPLLVAGGCVGAVGSAREKLGEGAWAERGEVGVVSSLLLVSELTAPGRLIAAGGMRGAVGNSAE
jgi:hypothetical protein